MSDAVIFKLDREADGLELARRWIEMRRPGGFLNTIAAYPIEVKSGLMRIACEIDARHSNFVRLVHGGVISALVDIAGGGATMTLLKPGQTLLTTDLNVRFLDAAPIEIGHLYAEGRVTHQAGRRAVVAVDINADDGATIAQGSVGISIRAPN